MTKMWNTPADLRYKLRMIITSKLPEDWLELKDAIWRELLKLVVKDLITITLRMELNWDLEEKAQDSKKDQSKKKAMNHYIYA